MFASTRMLTHGGSVSGRWGQGLEQALIVGGRADCYSDVAAGGQAFIGIAVANEDAVIFNQAGSQVGDGDGEF